jgi:hypothetical protein
MGAILHFGVLEPMIRLAIGYSVRQPLATSGWLTGEITSRRLYS